MDKDPIVAEVRKARELHAAAFGYNAGKIIADIASKQKKYGSRLVRRTPRMKLKATGT